MKNKKIIFSAVSLVILSLFAVFAFSFISSPTNPTNNQVQYGSNVCISTTGDFEGRETPTGDFEIVECDSNLVTNAGLDHIMNQLGQGATSDTPAFDIIGLCNATADCGLPAAGDTTLENEYIGTGGLARSAGTYSSLGTGNWSIFKTFTATTNALETNKTGIFNSTVVAGSTLLAENTFTLVTLQNNDQLTVNWTIMVTNP